MPRSLARAALGSSLLLFLAACGHSPQSVTPPDSTTLSTLALTPGSPDLSFGTQGQLTVEGQQSDVAALPDGSLLVVGTEGGDFTVTRVSPKGVVVQRRRIDLGGNEDGPQVFVQQGGKILITGRSGGHFGCARLRSDLRPDPSLGRNGTVVTEFNGSFLPAAAVQKDGKVLAGGSIWRKGSDDLDYALARFLPNGKPDPSFGNRGLVIVPAHTSTEDDPDSYYDDWVQGRFTALAVQEDGHIVAASETNYPGMYGTTAELMRFTKQGGVDRAYGQDGRVDLWSVSRFNARITDLALQADGQVVAVGDAWPDGCQVSRTSRDGRTREVVNLEPLGLVDGYTSPISVAMQGDGKLVVTGCSSSGEGPSMVVRLKSVFSLDQAFGTAGHVKVRQAGQVLVQPDGRIVVGLNTLTRLLP